MKTIEELEREILEAKKEILKKAERDQRESYEKTLQEAKKSILTVMRWLNNKDSVSQEDLEKNRRDANAVWAVNANDEAYIAASAAANGSVSHAACWVDEYFETTSEDRNEYEKELEK